MNSSSSFHGVPSRDSFLVIALALLVLATGLPPAAFAQAVELVPTDQRDIGSALAMSGEYMLVGAPGVDRTPGAAYIARRYVASRLRGPRWVLSSGVSNDPQFGRSVALSGAVAAVGADRRVHVYEQRTDGEWTRASVLESPRAEVTATFGAVVAVGDDQIAVSDAWIDGRGAVYRYERGDAGWTLAETLLPKEAVPEAQLFGRSLAFAGEDLVIGAVRASEGLGAVYVYRPKGDEFLQHAELLPVEGAGSASFGTTVVAVADRLVIASAARDGDPAHDPAVHVFERAGGEWSATAVVRPTEPALTAGFAASLALDDDRLVVGARGSDAVPGRVVQYARSDDGSWLQQTVLVADTPTGGDAFGQAVALSGVRAVIGSREEGGTLYEFVQEPDGAAAWQRQMTSTSAQFHSRDSYGRSVSAAGGILVVGAMGSATGVHVFQLEGAGVRQAVQRAVLDAPAPSTWFGHAVSTDGRQIVVGQENAAFVYERVDGTAEAWRVAGTLTPPRTVDGETFGFGYWVSIDDWIAVVGRAGQGPAHVFERDEQDRWQHVSVLETEPDWYVWDAAVSGEHIAAVDHQGLHVFTRRDWGQWQRGPVIRPSGLPEASRIEEVAIDGSTVAVAADGRLWIYERTGANDWSETWIETQQIETEYALFALQRQALDLDGDRLIVGSLQDTGGQFQPGAVVYGRGSDGVWRLHHRVMRPPDDDRIEDRLGTVVAIDGDVAVLGGVYTAYAFDVGTSTVAAEPEAGLPETFVLHGNYPNPFNPTTTLVFDLSAASDVAVEVVDVLGRGVIEFNAGSFPAGAGQAVRLDASTLPTGTYMYRITAGGAVRTGTMTLVR